MCADALEELTERGNHVWFVAAEVAVLVFPVEFGDHHVEERKRGEGEGAEGFILRLDHGHVLRRQEKREVVVEPAVAGGGQFESLAEVFEPFNQLLLLNACVLDKVREECVVGAFQKIIQPALQMRRCEV